MKILTMGGAAMDTIIEYSNPETLNLHSTRGTLSYLLLEEGKKIEVTQLGSFVGGGATNSALAFKKLGFDVSCFFKVGVDLQGDLIFHTMKTYDINVEHVKKDEKHATASSFIVPSLKGDRTVFSYRGANAHILKDDLPFAAIETVSQLYITSLSGHSAKLLPQLTEFAHKKNIPVAINPGISQLTLGGSFIAESLHNVDILILNSAEAKQLMVSLVKSTPPVPAPNKPQNHEGKSIPDLLLNPITHEEISFSLIEFFHRVLQYGVRYVVVTHGEEGVYVADKTSVYFHPVKSNQVVNTLGAGDAFGSSFVAYICKGESVDNAIRAGIINSASVIGHHDSKTGLLDSVQLSKEIKELNQSDLMVFSI